MRLYPRRKRNGTIVWWASWTENKVTVRRSTRQPTRELAKLATDRWARLRADPELEKARQATFGAEAAAFLKECRSSKRATATTAMYEQKLSNVCDVIGRETSMLAVTPESVSSYFELRRDEGAAGSTMFKEWVALKGVLTSARRRGRFLSDPKVLRPPWLTPDYEPKTTFLTWEQADRLLEILPPERRRTVAFVLATGARRGEWRRAQAGDINHETGHVIIRGTKTKASKATIRVPKIMHRWLAIAGQPPFPPWQNSRRDLRAFALRLDPPELEYARTWGRPTEGIPRFPRVTWNDLRRTFASLLVQAGVPNHLVAKLMRHKTTLMVDTVYGQQTADTVGDLVDKATSNHPSVNQRRSTQSNRKAPGNA